MMLPLVHHDPQWNWRKITRSYLKRRIHAQPYGDYLPEFDCFVISWKKKQSPIGSLAPSNFVDLLFYFQTFKVIKLTKKNKNKKNNMRRIRLHFSNNKKEEYLWFMALKLSFVSELRMPSGRMIYPLEVHLTTMLQIKKERKKNKVHQNVRRMKRQENAIVQQLAICWTYIFNICPFK